jgi:hypothetical protein
MVTKLHSKQPKVRRKVVLDELLHGKGKKKAPALGSDPFAQRIAADAHAANERMRQPPAPVKGLIPVHARLEAGIMRRIDALASRLDTRRSWGRTTRSEALRNALVAGLDALEAKERAQ